MLNSNSDGGILITHLEVNVSKISLLSIICCSFLVMTFTQLSCILSSILLNNFMVSR